MRRPKVPLTIHIPKASSSKLIAERGSPPGGSSGSNRHSQTASESSETVELREIADEMHEGAVSPLTIEPIPHSSEVDPDKMHEAHSKVAAAYEDVRSREIALMGKGFKLAEGIRTTQKEVRYLKKHGTPLNAGFLSWTATALKSVFGKKTDPVDLIHSLETKLRVQEIELRNLVSELDDVSRERQAEQQTVCNHLAYMEEMGVQLLYEEWYRKEAMPKYQRDYGYGKENGVFQLVPINWDILLEECELTEEEMEQEMFFDR